jgi:hypothetical protein
MIKTSKFDIFEASSDADADHFEVTYGDQDDGMDKIEYKHNQHKEEDSDNWDYRHELDDKDDEHTVVEFDNEEDSEITVIWLKGHHNLVFGEYQG